MADYDCRLASFYSKDTASLTSCSASPNQSNDQGPKMRGSSSEVSLPNLRGRPALPKPWFVEVPPLRATVRETRLPNGVITLKWRLDIDLEIPGKDWQLRSVQSTTPGVVTTVKPGSDKGRRRVEVDVAAPSSCLVEGQQRDPIELDINYILGGRPASRQMTVDWLCFLGDLSDSNDAAYYVARIKQQAHDPLIREFVARAKRLPRVNAQEEVKRLVNWLGFTRNDIQVEPPGLVSGGRFAYQLRPSEVSRLGGNCRGYTILIGAYLWSLGNFSLWTVLNPKHVWLKVGSKGSDVARAVDVDIVGQPGPPEFTSVTPVTEVDKRKKGTGK